ncbi:uncharacterized protein B0P05DRAFT_535139 [Gilbertella persicaria]|uniref:LIM zinc-binding domain-containing protein n=1 Tax=Rhizopus stolonifer TaxID=4846 RepID=A0A367J801_RHIST|nr:uncharacterized protein B0P05DRAFT_535139 [Gilbertella persicaria]KAI8084338.1 hypothetical protein B0P05DRAFT_535139 [Gilbertella persicaria]RCH86058.1 hypothetical protein CU098_005517 [Rhizopus stolonifer]
MGFCQRCGEITSGKCKKCGGRSVASTINCLAADGSISVVDRWQSQYADTILAPEEIMSKSPTSKRVPVTQSAFYDNPFLQKTVRITKLCTYCSKNLNQKSSYIVEDNSPYCKECHPKLFNKGICPSCQKPVTEKQDFIEHTNKIWHTSCFACFNCKTPLDASPLVDLENRPCCEPCFMGQAGKKKTSVSTRKRLEDLSISVPPVTSRYDSYSSQSSLSTIDSSRSSSSIHRPLLDQDLFQPKTPPLSRTPSPKEGVEDNEFSVDLLSRRHRTPHRLTTMFIPPTTSASSPLLQKATAESVSSSPLSPSPSFSIDHKPEANKKPLSLSQRPCHACQLPLGDASQKKIKIPLGPSQYAWFHKSCFVCSKCHMPFKNGECATDGHSFYHAQCDSFCSGCQKIIHQDSFKFNDKMYHFDCFRCFGSGCKLGFGQPIFEINQKPYCESCHTAFIASNQTPIRTTSTNLRQQQSQRVLPKLGGSKTCPRCRKSISIMDDAPGPFASRWHKKCLCCAKCLKQLDSDAKMRQGLQGESLVYCRNCIV